MVSNPYPELTPDKIFKESYTKFEKAGKRQSQSKGSVAKNQALLKDMRNESKIAPWEGSMGFMPTKIDYDKFNENMAAYKDIDLTKISDYPTWDIPEDLLKSFAGSG